MYLQFGKTADKAYYQQFNAKSNSLIYNKIFTHPLISEFLPMLYLKVGVHSISNPSIFTSVLTIGFIKI